MGEIFRRKNLISQVSVKKQNNENRKRNVIANFRVSKEEKRLIDNRIELSGLSRSDFFIQSCIHQKISTVGNVKTFSTIKQRLDMIEEHLLSIKKSDELDVEVLESLRTILEMYDGLEKN